MKRVLRMGSALAALALLAGCGHSPPTRFFTLDPAPPAQAAAARPLQPVQLSAVHIPPALDRPELVSEPAPNRLKLSEQDQWAAPLGEMMRRTLAQDLLARLPEGAFVLPDAPRAAETRGLVVDVLQLQTDAAGRTYLQASWTLMAGKPSRPVLTRTVELSVTGASGPEGEASSLSRLLGELADQIAVGLNGA